MNSNSNAVGGLVDICGRHLLAIVVTSLAVSLQVAIAQAEESIPRSSTEIADAEIPSNRGRGGFRGQSGHGFRRAAAMGFFRGPASMGFKGGGGYGNRSKQGPGYGERRDFEFQSLHRGFLFVDGVYVKPPYQLQVRGDQLRLNDVLIKSDSIDLSQGFDTGEVDRSLALSDVGGTLIDEGRKRGRQMRPIEQLCDAAHGTLALEGIVVIAKGMKPVLAERSGVAYEILVALVGLGESNEVVAADSNSSINEALLELRASDLSGALGSDVRSLRHLLIHFEGTPEFNERAEHAIALVRNADQSGDRIVKASLWADSIGYPLTLFAMLIVVVAFGHLLSNKPVADGVSEEDGVAPETRKVVIKSLLLFGLLSVVDLVWTIAAASTGSMREMNPLGEGMIADPIQLTLFKVTAVGTTIGLLYVLHHRPIAQVASWWSCLVLTLLTARWLTFNSMFM